MAKKAQKKGSKQDSRTGVSIPWDRVGRWAMALSLVAVLLGGGYLGVAWASNPNTLPLQLVRIEGEFKHLDRARLEQVVAGEVRGGFFSVDVETIREAVRQLPWVDEVAVRRVWPDTLRIWVAEQLPLARWGEKGLLNDRGEPFWPPLKEIPADLPRLSGPEGTEPEMVARYQELSRLLQPLELQVVQLRQDARGAWVGEFDNGASVQLGSRDLRLRFRRFVRLYPRLKAAGKGLPRQVDLRYTNGLVVHWAKDASSGEPQAAHKKTTDGDGLA
jgi:cell division protein FtsQ